MGHLVRLNKWLVKLSTSTPLGMSTRSVLARRQSTPMMGKDMSPCKKGHPKVGPLRLNCRCSFPQHQIRHTSGPMRLHHLPFGGGGNGCRAWCLLEELVRSGRQFLHGPTVLGQLALDPVRQVGE